MSFLPASRAVSSLAGILCFLLVIGAVGLGVPRFPYLF
jgi:hypothetical protein